MPGDELDDYIESIAVKGDAADSDNKEAAEKAAADAAAASNTVAVAAANEKKDNAEQSKPTAVPRDLGIEGDDWEVVKAQLNETGDLRRELELVKSLPKTVFANDKLAGLNALITKMPSLGESKNAYSVYEDIISLTNEDPLKVLTTKFILDNPEFVGQEEFVSKNISKEYNIDTENNSPEEIQFNKTKLKKAADVAFTDITGLRESLKSVGAPAPIDVPARENEWKTNVEQEISVFEKLKVPVINPKTKEPETYIEYEIPVELRAEFAEKASKAYAKMGDSTNPAVKQRIKDDFVKDFLFTNFANIGQAIKLKAETDKEAEVDARYAGAGGLHSKETSGASAERDAYEKIWD